MKKITLIRTLYFTEGGKELFERLVKSNGTFMFCGRPDDIERKDFVEEAFCLHIPLLFIGSAGIAVRLIAPYVKDKLLDPPVIVIDEGGRFVIPLLSGHYGGGVDTAKELADSIFATLVETSASDVRKTFAIDVFAKRNGYYISDSDHDLVKKINAGALNGERPEMLDLHRKNLCLGMGCKKGKSFSELKAFLNQFYDDDALRRELYAIGTIDAKAKETGLLTLAAYYGAFFFAYSKEELSDVTYDGLSSSDFVKETVGVDNVCERAALLLSGGHELMMKKQAGDGITLAAASRSGE